MMCDAERLRETLGRPELARLVRRLRSRVERGKPLMGILALNGATPAERDAIDRLLGRVPTQGAALAIPIGRLETKLRAAGICPDLRSALEELGGALVDRKAERESIERQWAELFALAQTPIQSRPELVSWLEQVRTTGLLRRYELADARRLLFQALDVVDALPASNIPLAELAAAVVGDAHALDPGTSLGSLVLRAAAAMGKCERFDDARSRRETWAAVGVICDELSAPVLVLNLPVADTRTVTDRMLALCVAAGEPVHLTVRQLLGAPPSFAVSRPRRPCMSARIRASWPPRPGGWAQPARRWCALTDSPAPRQGCCWMPCGPRVRGCCITAILIGREFRSRTRSCSGTAPSRGE